MTQLENRIVIFAPRGRDAQVIKQFLEQRGLVGWICQNITALLTALKVGASSAIVTEEAVDSTALAALSVWIADQPVWSDFPFVVLTAKRPLLKPGTPGNIVMALGNAVLVERPISGDSLASAARSALRARQRQYDARTLLLERERSARSLREADRRKDQFLAMLAHELRNPLAPIRSAAEVLKQIENDAQPRVKWARELIERQSRHLSSLLEDLLDISRITTGKITLKQVELELNLLIARAIESAQSSIDARQHSLQVSLPPVLVFVKGDAVRLTQVVGNLLDNAAKYTPTGGRISVDLTVLDGRVVLTVADDGVGISAEDLPHIFEMFNQADRALDRAQGGLGIGLSLVRSILAMHGGDIRAESAGRGKGTCLIASLPLLTTTPVEHKVQDASEARGPAPAKAGSTSHDILIIDDNADSAEALAVLLEMHGHRIRVSADGLSGLSECQSRWPDIVLLDIGLPIIDGYEVARRLRSLAAGRPQILVAVTGYGQASDIERSREVGFDHHVVKPVEPDLLLTLFAR